MPMLGCRRVLSVASALPRAGHGLFERRKITVFIKIGLHGLVEKCNLGECWISFDDRRHTEKPMGSPLALGPKSATMWVPMGGATIPTTLGVQSYGGV